MIITSENAIELHITGVNSYKSEATSDELRCMVNLTTARK
jgi:hypothetical protein